MPPIDQPASFDPKTSAAEGRKAKSTASAPEQPEPADLVAFTVDASSGRIVKIERVDAAGARRELSEDETARLAKRRAQATLERVVEQAFEAGIDCVLGDEFGREEPPESKADGELSRVLLRSLIERSAAKRLTQLDVLSPAIVGTLMEYAAAVRPGAAPH